MTTNNTKQAGERTHVVIQVRSFYGPKTEQSLVASAQHGYAEQFASAADAQKRVAELNEAVYYTAHNESGRAEYKVARINSLPGYLRAQL